MSLNSASLSECGNCSPEPHTPQPIRNPIKMDDWIVLKFDAGKYNLIKVNSKSVIKFKSKQKFRAPLLAECGCEYGKWYFMHVYTEDGVEKIRILRTSHDIVNQCATLLISNDEILMKKFATVDNDEGVVKSIIVDKIHSISNNNENFANKNDGSKFKYVEKKIKRFFMIFYVERPKLTNICEFYFYSGKIPYCINIRPDYFNQIMYFAELNYKSNSIVYESHKGLIAASVYQKIGSDQEFAQSTLLHFDRKQVQGDMVPFSALFNKSSTELSSGTNYFFSRFDVSLDKDEFYGSMDRLLGQNCEKLQRVLQQRAFSSLIMACSENLPQVLEALYPLLCPSAKVVIFSNVLQPVLDCYKLANKKLFCCDLFMNETFFREYQIDQDRAHPIVKSPGVSGFLLRFTKTVSNIH